MVLIERSSKAATQNDLMEKVQDGLPVMIEKATEKVKL